MKADLPFPLAYLVLRKLLFCCIIRALKCSFHPQTQKDPSPRDGRGDSARHSLPAPHAACAGTWALPEKLRLCGSPEEQGLVCPAALGYSDAN